MIWGQLPNGSGIKVVCDRKINDREDEKAHGHETNAKKYEGLENNDIGVANEVGEEEKRGCGIESG